LRTAPAQSHRKSTIKTEVPKSRLIYEARFGYDTEGEDIVISGKARKDDGKGYRAITYAAFMVGVLRQANQKHRRHPGFIVMDSPLVTYREPDENMGDGQVIVLENEEPPEDLRNSIAYTAFTKNRNTGRYGLFPPLLPTEQPVTAD
jgi:hypothetical protein